MQLDMTKDIMKNEDKISTKFIAILRYDQKEPRFHTPKIIVDATDDMSAIMQLNLMDVNFIDVMRYVENGKIYD
jgi:hypothetical protein